jgi:23S rRNA (uridine2552-2'-O)-methyltransferase
MNNWIGRQNKDPFVKERNKNNLLSRAYFKLQEIDEKFNIFKNNHNVLELGCAPGGWTQYLITKVNQITAIDLLPLQLNSKKVDFHQVSIEDFSTTKTYHGIVSDLAPNMSGNRTVDRFAMENLLEIVFNKINLCEKYLICKIFQYNIEFIKTKVKKYDNYFFFKPNSSRKESQEIYFVYFLKSK